MSKTHYGEGNVRLRGNIYWIRYWWRGKAFQESAKTADKKEALKFLRKRLAEKDAGAGPNIGAEKVTVKQLLDNVRADYLKKRRRMKGCEHLMRMLLADDSPLAHLRAVEVGSRQLDAYRKHREASGVQPQTVNREISMLRRAWNLGAQQTPPLVASVPKMFSVAMGPEAKPRQGFFERSELEKLMKELPKHLKGIALFAWWTGCRRDEILQMRWEWVDADFGMVRIPGEFCKNGEARIIPLVPELRDMLFLLKGERDAHYPEARTIFTKDGRRFSGSRMYADWNAAIERGGVQGATYLHDMRRTAARNLIRAGVPQSIAKKITGHKTDSMFSRYNITDERDLVRAAEQLHHYGSRQEIAPVSGGPAVAEVMTVNDGISEIRATDQYRM